jgi:hypothetical protein
MKIEIIALTAAFLENIQKLKEIHLGTDLSHGSQFDIFQWGIVIRVQ